MAAWKTLVFPCLLVSATLIVALPQRGSQVIENAGTSLFEKEINYLAIDPSPPQNNLTGQPFSQKEGIRDKRDQINIIVMEAVRKTKPVQLAMPIIQTVLTLKTSLTVSTRIKATQMPIH